MRIAAILSLSEDQRGAEDFAAAPRELSRLSGIPGTASLGHFDVLGQNLLDRALDKLKQFGVSRHTIISEGASSELLPSRTAAPSAFVETWDRAIANYMAEGVNLLLLLRANIYSDLDYVQLLQFHLENQGPITQAYAADGALEVAFVDASCLRDGSDAYSRTLGELLPQQRRFLYRGYVNRLASPQDFYKLVEDGLHGQCSLRPIGTETQERVWQGVDSEIDRSAIVTGPAFVGAGSRISACCTVAGGSSIERNCEVDCGTVVEESWVMQETYLGVALDVRRSIVTNDTLFHLDRNVEVKIADHNLIGAAAKSAPLLAGLGSFLWGERQVTG